MVERASLTDVPPIPEGTIPSGDKEQAPKRPRPYWVLSTLRKCQKYSAYSFTVFACLHLTSVAVLPAIDQSSADAAFMFARSIYQSGVGEQLVLGSAAVHVLSGVSLHLRRIYLQNRDFGRTKLFLSKMSISGGLLSMIVLGHVVAMRLGPLLKLGDSSLISLDFVRWLIHHQPVQAPLSLLLLVFLYSYHSVEGYNMFLRLKLKEKSVWALVLVAIAITASSVAALSKGSAPTGWLADQFALAHSIMEF